MPPLDITDLELAIEDLIHNAAPTEPKPPSTPFPTYPDDEAQHLYSLKIPMPLWRALKHRVGEGGNKAKFVRQAIYDKLNANPPNPQSEPTHNFDLQDILIDSD